MTEAEKVYRMEVLTRDLRQAEIQEHRVRKAFQGAAAVLKQAKADLENFIATHTETRSGPMPQFTGRRNYYLRPA